MRRARVAMILVALAGVALTLVAPVGPAGAVPPATLVGAITDAAGHTPIAGAQVRAYSAAYGTLYGQTTTAADGTYALSLPAGSYRLLFDATNFQQQYSGGSSTWAGSSAVSLPSGVDTTYDVALTPVSLGGSVTETPTGAPVAGAQVSAYSAVYGTLYGRATTAADGRYELMLPAGNYRLRFAAAGHVEVFSGGSSTWSGSAVVLVPNGGVTTVLDASMAPSSPQGIQGTVTGSVTGKWVKGIRVRAYGGAWSALYAQTTTGSGGTYTLQLPVGDFRLVFDDPAGNFPATYSGGSPTWIGSSTVHVSPSTMTTTNATMVAPVGADCAAARAGQFFPDLSNLDLRGCDLSNSWFMLLEGSDLRGANLRGAYFVALTDADLRNADLSGSTLAMWACDPEYGLPRLVSAPATGVRVEGAHFDPVQLVAAQFGRVGTPAVWNITVPPPVYQCPPR